MIGVVFLSLMGAGLLYGLVDMFDSDNEAQQTEDPNPDEPETGTDILYTGEETLTGTEFADTLTADNPAHTADSATLVNLLGGDDVAEVATPFSTTLDGGDGNDTLTSTEVGNTLIGGAGDDILSGINANTIDGGAGDDTLNLDLTAAFNDSVARVEGGDGDDTIAITAGAGQSNLDVGGAIVTGGAGADSFEVTLQLDEEPLPADPTEVIDSGTAFRVDDFKPSEDRLQVTIERTEGSEDRDLVETTLTEVTVGEQSYYELELTFEASATAASTVTSIRIDSTEIVTLDDIVIVTNNPASTA